MTREEIIKHLHEALNSVDITFPYRYVFVEAIEALSQPSLPSNLDGAAELSANGAMIKIQFPSVVYNTGLKCFDHSDLIKQFKAGAEWMARQGETKEAVIGMATEKLSIKVPQRTLNKLNLCLGDKVVVQIRKK